MSLELLERSLGYTRGQLAGVADDLMHVPTPCRGWSLRALLTHMDDALDAFGEGALGVIDPFPARPALAADVRVQSLQDKACRLLGAWSAVAPVPVAVVDVGGLPVDVSVISGAAALEITLHGWDVGRATGVGRDLPPLLARDLREVAAMLITARERSLRFAAPRRVGPGADDADRLLAWSGRDPAWST